MATFEEKILAYLDGSLSAEGREELLAGMSGNGARAAANRALFEEHIRMADLISLAQKPVSAPLSMQRDLASKIPVLAVKLPYLASEPNRREPATAGWFGWPRSTSIVTILVAALALITGCVWFALNQKNSSSGSDGQSLTASSANANGQPASSSVGSSQNSAQTVTPQNSNGEGIDGNASVNSAKSTKIEVSHPHTSVHAISMPSQDIAAPDNLAQNENMAMSDESQTTKPENSQKSGGQIELHSAKIPPSSPAEIIGSGSTAHSLSALSESEENTDPFRAFAVEEYRFIRLSPQAPLSDFSRANGLQTNTLGFESPEFGLDYALDPWFSIGLRGGDARFVREQSVTTNASGYQYLGVDTRETILLDPFFPWIGPALTYSLSASQSASFTGTVAAGNIFATALAGGISPFLRGEFAFLYDMSNSFALRFAASYETDWVPSATSLNFAPSNSISGVVIGSNAATHESQVFGISLGLTFHP